METAQPKKKYFKNFWKYRYLLKEIVVKNVKLQYRNSVLGVFWTFLQPLLMTIVLALVFEGFFGKGKKPGEYITYMLAGRLLFDFFKQSTKRAMLSIRNSASVIKKVYVPKYIYPISNVTSCFVTFTISLTVLLAVMLFYFFKTGGDTGWYFSWNMLLFFVPVIILFVFCLGAGLILSVLEVFFKDIEYIYEVICTVLFYLTPIMYYMDSKSIKFGGFISTVIRLNPLYSITNMFRSFVLGSLWDWNWLWYSALVSVVLFVIGLFVFYKSQDKFILHI